jgi:hypothetical protein
MRLFGHDFPEMKPVFRPFGVAWLVFYCLFLVYAAAHTTGFLIIDYVNLRIHEGGHSSVGSAIPSEYSEARLAN